MKATHKGFKRLYKSATYSVAGLKSTWQHEEAFRVEVITALICILSMPFIVDNPVEFILLCIGIALVLISELLNSAIESLVDRVGEEYHELSGRAKDQASAAVFIALVLCAIIWAYVAFT